VGQVPIHYAHRRAGGQSWFHGDYTDSPAAPLHRFGFGLSTTTVEYSDIEASPGSTTESTLIRAVMSNTGARAADEVVQLYAVDEVASVARPVRQLVGFTRVHLAPGEVTTVAFEVHPSRLAFYDEEFHFVCEPGAFDFEIGGCAGSPAETVTVDIDGEVHQYRQSEVVATEVVATGAITTRPG
jgi:beta-glucosidase